MKTKIEIVSLATIVPLRHKVLRAGHPLKAAFFEGDDRKTTLHFASFLAEGEQHVGKLVGCATFMINPIPDNTEPAWQLRGMATDPSFKKCGVGTELLQHGMHHIMGISSIRLFWCHGREPAVTFYQRMGWLVVSPVYEIETAGPHRMMIRYV